jgi:hypothetical protein
MDTTILQKRLTELNAEYERGKQLLAEQEAQSAALRQQILRISGAIQVLSELLGGNGVTDPRANASSPKHERPHATHTPLA